MRAALVVFVVVFGVSLGITRLVDARAPGLSHLSGDDRASASSSSVPSLSSDQRTQLQLRVLIYRNAQLELEALVKDLTVPGYTVDLNTLVYVKTPAPEGSK